MSLQTQIARRLAERRRRNQQQLQRETGVESPQPENRCKGCHCRIAEECEYCAECLCEEDLDGA